MRPVHFFLRRLRDIDEWLTPPTDEYRILQIAGHLRQCLLDQHALLDVANAEYRIKFRFELADFENDCYNQHVLTMSPDSYFEMDGLSPRVRLTRNPAYKIVNREEFLGSTVGIVKGEKRTVRDMIKHAANKLGAVHLDNPAAHQQALMGMIGGMRLMGMDAGIRVIVPIAQIFLAGVQPLRDAIEAASA